MKTLIVYYSFTGNNEALVKKLHQRTGCEVLRIQAAKKRTNVSILLDLIFKRNPKLQEYTIPFSDHTHLILVAPVWAGKIATPMQTFLKNERRNILNYSFITLCSGVAGQKGRITEYLNSTLRRKPIAVEELWVNDLLPPEQKDKIRFATPYRVKEDDWRVFDPKVDAFIATLKGQTSDPMPG